MRVARDPMGRRTPGLFDQLILCPWWVSVILAVGAYLLLRHTFPPLAPVATFFLLMIAALSAFYSFRKRELLDRQQGLSTIRELSWQRFETLVGEAYRRQGYAIEENLVGGPDGGVDLVLRKDGERVLVQCKQWRTWRVGIKVVRELYGVMMAEEAQRAVIVTSGTFTQEARGFARRKPIDLVAGEQLAQLIAMVQESPSSGLSQTPLSSPTMVSPTVHVCCPTCGSEMVRKTARRGPNPGQQFWGCSRYPACRGTRPYRP
jgi:restriction system protein